jgi:uncharacterized membrane protein (UPF0127 family)
VSRLAILAVLLLTVPAAADESLDEAFAKDVLIIVSAHHSCHRFDIYLALTFNQQRRGLMYVRELPEHTGMLFVYDGEDYRSMWMKNTYIPLDMLFAREDGTVSSIIRNTEPQSLKSLASIEPVSYVLELNAGVADKLGIDENSRLIWESDNE